MIEEFDNRKGGRGQCSKCKQFHNNVSFHEAGCKPLYWKCKRCNTIVDMDKFNCECIKSPSPWEPIYIEN